MKIYKCRGQSHLKINAFLTHPVELRSPPLSAGAKRGACPGCITTF